MNEARLFKLRARPQYNHLDDMTLLAAIDTAVSVFEDYTNRDDPGERADGVIVELACVALNRLGAEGSVSASEGGMSRTWDQLPETTKALMDRWRRPFLPRRSS